MQVVVFIVILVSFVMFLFILDKKREIYEDPNDYDYDRENPNALVQGVNIAGTVYASDPDNVPGLGWIL